MNKTEFATKLKSLNSVQIFCHTRPDGDTLSSAFALKLAFEKMGKRAEVVCADLIPTKFLNLGFLGELSAPKMGFDGYIATDVASETLFGDTYDFFIRQTNTFSIDHHVSNTNFSKYNYVVDNAANTINVFDLICEMGVEIDKDLANLIFLGVCTDTNNFSNNNTDKRAFEVAAILSGAGADTNFIYTKMYKSQTVARAKMYAHVMGSIKFFHNDRVAIVTSRIADLERFGATQADTQGFIDFPLTIDSVEIAIAVLEKADKQFKISFRSKTADVNALSGVFGGGGHLRASGALICGYYEDVIDKLVFNSGNYLD